MFLRNVEFKHTIKYKCVNGHPGLCLTIEVLSGYVDQMSLALVSLQSRINLSPFTKDFRAGEPSMSL